MRDPTPRELLLQNLLARSTVLLFQTAKALERSADPQHQTLVIECQNWFSEARQSISGAIRSEAPPAGMPSPAPIAGNSGENSKWTGWASAGSSPPIPAKTIPQPSAGAAPSSTGSAGGITPSPIPGKTSKSSPTDYFGMNP